MTDADTDLLESLTHQFSWPRQTNRPEVQYWLKTLLRDKDEIIGALERSKAVLPIVAQQFQTMGLPAELTLLPMIESSYYAPAVSSAGAAGLWQLMPNTAEDMSLKSDWWYDERFDIQLSTQAAGQYLNYLARQFKQDWPLALAAYNGGISKIKTAALQQAGSPKADYSFWDLQLKEETENYVPRFLALLEIIANPDRYHIELPIFSKDQALVALTVDKQLDLRIVAGAAGLSFKEFKKYNNGYKRWITPPRDGHRVLLPKSKAQQFQRQAELEPELASSAELWQRYVVKQGDSLLSLSRRFGVTLRSLLAVNQTQDHNIVPGTILFMPISEKAPVIQSPKTVNQLHIVSHNESLWEIARDHGVSIAEIRKLNKLAQRETIHPGQVLVTRRGPG